MYEHSDEIVGPGDTFLQLFLPQRYAHCHIIVLDDANKKEKSTMVIRSIALITSEISHIVRGTNKFVALRS